MVTELCQEEAAMGFWWFVFICDLIIPITMIGLGKMMWKYGPKDINWVVGYRTARSMRNKDTWQFAQEYCGRLWWKIGWVLLPLSAVIHIPFYNSSEDTVDTVCVILCIIQCVILVGTIFPVEKALKRRFTDEGIRKFME